MSIIKRTCFECVKHLVQNCPKDLEVLVEVIKAATITTFFKTCSAKRKMINYYCCVYRNFIGSYMNHQYNHIDFNLHISWIRLALLCKQPRPKRPKSNVTNIPWELLKIMRFTANFL